MRNTGLRRTAFGVIAVLVVVFLVGACGSASGQSDASPTVVEITLSEFRIDSSQTTFTTGTRYHFLIRKEGTISHDWAITPRGGTDESQALIKVDEDQLPPGATVTREFTFTQTADSEFAFHVPGHYEADMLLPIVAQ